MASRESRFMTNIPLVGVAFEQVHFRFGWGVLDVQFNFINISYSLSLFLIRLVDNFSISFPFEHISLYIAELARIGSESATITDNKIRFSEVCSYGPIRLTVKYTFMLFSFYPNQCRLLGGTP